MRWAGYEYIAHMGERENATKCFVGKIKERDYCMPVTDNKKCKKQADNKNTFNAKFNISKVIQNCLKVLNNTQHS
jgi:hypothetical protein